MASVIHVEPKVKWKKVKIAPNILSKGGFDGLIDLQVLTDYDLIKSANYSFAEDNRGKKSKKKKNIKKVLDPESIRINKTKTSSSLEGHKSNIQKKKERKKNTTKNYKEEKSNILNGQNVEVIKVSQNKQPQNEEQAAQKKGTEAKSKPKEKQKRKAEILGVCCELTTPQKKIKLTAQDAAEDFIQGMESWNGLNVPHEVLRALRDLKFTEPTPIQAQVLPHAIRDRLDIIGAAETGSGKTLAFGIPLIHSILQYKTREARDIPNTALDEDELQSSDESFKEEYEEFNVSAEGQGEERKEEIAEDNDEELDTDEREDISNEMPDDEESDSDETNILQEGEIGLVKVIDNADFTWLDNDHDSAKVTLPNRSPLALVLEPTRELAIQVRDHIKAVAKYTGIQVAAIVGGLSQQKQLRILKRCPEIIVATPGRLWELIQEGEPYLSQVEEVRYLVVDEADRMEEKGHFEELSKLLELINVDEKKRKQRQTFVFSATLTMVLPGPRRVMKKKRQNMAENQKLEMLMGNIGLKERPKVIDLTLKTGTVSTLTEAKINCTVEEKDYYLYYFLKLHPGRTLVFTNSKDCIRRLMSIFTLLKCQPLSLHADMHQRQRLKNLERFTANDKGLLLASDVAARGLDIPNVQHVIHYQVPHTVENYVHRSGRTARASKEGLSVMIIGPDDTKNYRKIMHALNKDDDLPMFPVEHQYMPEIKVRVCLARQIDTKEYRWEIDFR
ncbi:hypothetical protein CHS0354_027660 [Potamilus streckersoni]|uniref:ATP-dependent RNA helicase n=1 Tax=Potamilus streckersoni TaxID=2493646 RepID=A0AAE0W567_9BIVA|nr:hypothetical protein CHS0354_027660 [Potamilus streckersoni]